MSEKHFSLHRRYAMKSRTKYYLVALFTLLLMVVGQMAGPLTATASAANVIPVGETYGATYGEWSARWWQWLLSFPKATNPNLGGDPTQGQYDDVWFLPGTFRGTEEYTITIPAGKPIFFTIINTIVPKPYGYETLVDLRRQAAAFIDTNLEATIDGTPVQNLSNFRVRSPSFTVIPPAKAVLPPGWFKVPGNTDPIVSDGYWLLLSPLPVGQHTIHIHGEATNLTVDINYILNISP
jgi:hypothetical protein